MTRLSTATPYPGTAALVPVAGAAAVIAAGCATPSLGPRLLLDRAPLRLVGKLSYSWYLWHWPMLVLAARAAGHPLPLAANLGLTVLSAALALATVVMVENPIRFSPRVAARPRRALALGAGLTALAAVAASVTAGRLPPLRGTGQQATAAALPSIASPGAGRAAGVDRDAARLTAITAPVTRAVVGGVAVRAVPANLQPSLDRAYADKPASYIDGCHDDFPDIRIRSCAYGAPRSPTTIVLYGDSHALQWFPGLDRIARARHWRLVALTKSTCPPLQLALYSPVLHHSYWECDQWRAAAEHRIQAKKPAVVVLGVARHYGPEYRFGAVFGPAWLTGLRATVRHIRALGAAVLVLGPTPKPPLDVPDCLAGHLSNVAACTSPVRQVVRFAGIGAERAVVLAAGGRYADVTPWTCSPTRCPVIVGNLLVYRDDNHLTTSYPTWLAPLLNAELDEAMAASPTSRRTH